MRLLTCLLLALSLGSAHAQVHVTELMAGNRSGLQDVDRNPSDWIELHNAGSEPAELGGWYLTDSRSEPMKWQMPDVRLDAGGFLVVFASAKDRKHPLRELHTNFRLGRDGGEVLLVAPGGEDVRSRLRYGPQSPDVSFGTSQSRETRRLVGSESASRWRVPQFPAKDWQNPGYTDDAWKEGTGQLGYDLDAAEFAGTDVKEAMRRQNTTFYARFTFHVDDLASLGSASLKMTFRDGFVAFLNGKEIARHRAPEKLTWTSAATEDVSAIDEVLTRRFTTPAVLDALVEGRNVLAIQAVTATKFARSFVLAPELEAYVATAPDPSRTGFFATPTPGSPNGEPLDGVTAPPRFVREGGLFRDRTTVEIAAADPGSEVRYTLDGSEPTPASPRYGAPFDVEETCEVRARAWSKGRAPSEMILTHCVRRTEDLDDFDSNLPLVVVSTFGRRIRAKKFTPALVHVVAPAENGRASLSAAPVVTGGGAVKTRGSSTLLRPKKAYGLELRDALGRDRASELLGMPADSDWILYGPYNFDQALIRNPLCYELARRLGLPSIRTRFVEAFVNTSGPVSRDDYVGLYVLMEKIKRGRHRLDLEELTPRHTREPAISGGYILKIDRPGPEDVGFESGDQKKTQYFYPKERLITDPQRQWIRGHLDEFWATLQSPGFADPDKGYARFIDVDNFIDYHFFEEYTKNPDAFTLSTYYHKPRGGKLRMGPVWDFDRAIRTNDNETWVGRPGRPTGWTKDSYYGWWGVLFRDPAFRKRYRARCRRWLSTVLSLDRVHALVDEMAAEIAEARQRDHDRWPIQWPGQWESEILDLKEFIATRHAWFQAELLEKAEFSSSTGLFRPPFELDIRKGNADGVLWYTTDGSDPRRQDGGVSAGARKWEGPVAIDSETRVRARERVGDVWSRETDAFFVTGTPTLSITEVMYNPPDGRDYEFVEVFNHGNQTVDLRGIRLTGTRIGFHFGIGDVTELLPGEYAVVVRDRAAFERRYDTVGMNIAGQYEGKLSNSEGTVTLTGAIGQRIGEVRFEDSWHPKTDRNGHSLVAANVGTYPASQKGWRVSRRRLGSPGRAEPAP